MAKAQSSADVPHFEKLLEFETSCATHMKKPPNRVTSFAANANSSGSNCVVCKAEKHPLYVCVSLDHSLTTKRSPYSKLNLCLNYLTSGHFRRQCKSTHKCKVWQKLHHTLLHIDQQNPTPPAGSQMATPVYSTPVSSTPVSSNGDMKLKLNALLMTCRVSVIAPDGSSVEPRALLDNASSASFVSKRLVQSLSLPRFNQKFECLALVVCHKGPLSQLPNLSRRIQQKEDRDPAVVVPKVTCDLPLAPVPFQLNWKHLADLDPGFGQPGRIDMLLGVNLFLDVLCHGRRSGPLESPTALETEFGWVLCGSAGVTTFYSTVTSGDDILRQFWEIEETPADHSALSTEERTVVRHFESNHSRSKEGRFVVPLPRNPSAKQIGESRSQAIIKEIPLTRTLSHCKGSLQGARPCHARIS